MESRPHRRQRRHRRGSGNLPAPDAHISADGVPALRQCRMPARVPTGATYKRREGPREVDDKFIGCRMCMAACPYNALACSTGRSLSVPRVRTGATAACRCVRRAWPRSTLCKERTDDGDKPMCVACCPARARIFGDLDDPDSEISKVIRDNHAYVLLEEQGAAQGPLLQLGGCKMSNKLKATYGVLGALVVAGVAAWICQLANGLGVTGMSNGVSWGLYIACFMFFVG